jgi:hypothetical protein
MRCVRWAFRGVHCSCGQEWRRSIERIGRPPFGLRGLSTGQSSANDSTPNGKQALKDKDTGVVLILRPVLNDKKPHAETHCGRCYPICGPGAHQRHLIEHAASSMRRGDFESIRCLFSRDC